MKSSTGGGGGEGEENKKQQLEETKGEIRGGWEGGKRETRSNNLNVNEMSGVFLSQN